MRPSFPGEGVDGIPPGSVDTTPIIEDPIAYALRGDESSSGSSQILVRGIFVPGTMHCREIERTGADSTQPSNDQSTILSCFADFVTSE